MPLNELLYRSRSSIQFVYSIHNNLPDTQISFLLKRSYISIGITFSFNLNFRQHIDNNISKALKILDL